MVIWLIWGVRIFCVGFIWRLGIQIIRHSYYFDKVAVARESATVEHQKVRKSNRNGRRDHHVICLKESVVDYTLDKSAES